MAYGMLVWISALEELILAYFSLYAHLYAF